MDAYIRFGDLASWLALPILEQLQRDTGVSITFHPMLGTMGDVSGSNVKAGEDDPLAAYRSRRREARRLATERELERMCEMLGLETRQGARKIDPLMLSLGLVWANERGESSAIWGYVTSAFDATFRTSAKVESMGTVETLLEASGVPVDRFAEAFMAAAGNLQDDQETWLERGIYMSPAFEVEGELFLGREHLPLIRWKLEGGNGSPPV